MEVMRVKIVMIFLFFAISLAGVGLPVLSPPSWFVGEVVSTLTALSSGVMLGVALIHLIPEGSEILDEFVDPKYNLSYILSGIGVLVVLTVESITIAMAPGPAKRDDTHSVWSAARPYQAHQCHSHPRSQSLRGKSRCKHPTYYSLSDRGAGGSKRTEAGDVEQRQQAEQQPEEEEEGDTQQCEQSSLLIDHCKDVEHVHGSSLLSELGQASTTREVIALYALEFSIAVHSLILGIGYGIESRLSTMRVLAIALGLHQFIEGIAIGSSIVQLRNKSLLPEHKVWLFILIYGSTVSLGVLVGLLVGTTAWLRLLQGVFNSLAAGSLLYVCLAEQVGQQFRKSEFERNLPAKLRLLAAMGLGFWAMSVLAWME